MSINHESIRNESKLALENYNQLNERLYHLEDEKDGIDHMLLYSRRPLTEDQRNEYENRLNEINTEINDINQKRISGDFKSAMSTARVASLPSFQERNAPNVDKVLSDPNLLKHITSFNTKIGGTKKRKYIQ